MSYSAIVLLACIGAALGSYHRVVNDCTCEEKGNYYSPISGDNCGSFTQTTAYLPAEVQICPYGLQFNVQRCVCDYKWRTGCPNSCAAGYYRPHGYNNMKYTSRVVSGYSRPNNYNNNRNTYNSHNNRNTYNSHNNYNKNTHNRGNNYNNARRY